MYQEKGTDVRATARIGYSTADSVSVRPIPEIAAAQERLTTAIAVLDKQTSELVNCLAPVLHPDHPVTEGKLKDSPPRSTALGCDLHNLTEQVDRISSFIESTRNRLGI